MSASAAAPPAGVNVLFQGVEKSSQGYKLLESMGWKEGEGLGAQKQGITTHIRVKKKDGALGVGSAEQAARLRDWTLGMTSYESILLKLKEVKAAPRAVTSDSGSESGSSSEEEEAAPAAAPASARGASKPAAGAAAAAGAKAAKAASKSTTVEKAASAAAEPKPKRRKGADAEAAAVAAAAPVPATAKVTHVGRYQKRERAKHAGGYSAADMAAILGTNPADADFKAAPVFAAVVREESPEAESEEEQVAADEDGAGAADRPKAKATRAPPAPGPAPSLNDWWGSIFTRSGAMGSMRRETRAAPPSAGDREAIRVTGFREADQENLYTQAQDKAAVGRQGLGRSGMPKKVAGERWCGTKTKIAGDSSEEEQDDDETKEAAQEESEEDEGIVVLAAKGARAPPAAAAAAAAAEQPRSSGGEGRGVKRSVAAAAAPEGAAAAAEEGKPSSSGAGAAEGSAPRGERMNWAELAVQVLGDTPKRRLKLAKLQKRLLAAAAAAGGGGGVLTLESVGKSMMKRLRKCSQLVVDAEYVALA